MTDNEKLNMVKTILRIEDNSEDTLISTYLTAAEQEILHWRYSNASTMPTEVPARFEMTQVFAVTAGYSISGAEGEVTHSENGISRTFKYEDMLAYIRSHVIAIASVV